MTNMGKDESVDDTDKIFEDIVHLGRLGMAGRPQDVQAYLQRLSRRWRNTRPELAKELGALIRQSPTRSSPMRDFQSGLVQPTPVDVDSRLDLVKHEFTHELPVPPIWEERIGDQLEQLIAERNGWELLAEVGLVPTRNALFIGPPGVGKTLAARFLAHRLKLPLMILDLAAVMSSLLGRTGTNVRQVMDYAKAQPCVLLLDEFDAVAKKRDDIGEIGELKRLVAVLLQAVDDWPPSGLLLAATNHPDLLDPAVWRRFELIVEFPMPRHSEIRAAVAQFLGGARLPEPLLDILATLLQGESFSNIERDLLAIRRRAAIGLVSVETEVMHFVELRAASLPLETRAQAAAFAVNRGDLSQRKAHEVFKVSRDVIRRASIASHALPSSEEDRIA